MYSDNFVFVLILNVLITVVTPALTVKFPPAVENPGLVPLPPEDANVTVSVPALVVIVMLLPATNVNVSVAESATTLL